MRRLSALGSESFERYFFAELQEMSDDLAHALGGQLRALILAGGYGRGEGAVVRVGRREMPYNDVDLVPVVGRPRRRWPLRVHAVRRSWQDRLGIHVDLSRPVTARGIRRWPHRLLWHDVVCGHRVLWGDRKAVGRSAPAYLRQPPPLIEATRLLVNRGAGLIEATRRLLLALPPDPCDEDFVRRNGFKADLAAMDALLIAYRSYHPSVFQRPSCLRRLQRKVPGLARMDLLPAARRAVRFKVFPCAVPAPIDLRCMGRRIARFASVLCHVETLRRGRELPGLSALAGDREPWEIDENRPARIPVNIVRQLGRGRLDWRSPRQSLLPEMALLLDESPLRSASVGTTATAAWCERARDFFTRWTELS
ncbi:MAG: hypothetical protein MPN21_16170 [Thermoanaerobaculia bacterium]|nr:hypothetical protein [Thermoanaerobaculia bacterium]